MNFSKSDSKSNGDSSELSAGKFAVVKVSGKTKDSFRLYVIRITIPVAMKFFTKGHLTQYVFQRQRKKFMSIKVTLLGNFLSHCKVVLQDLRTSLVFLQIWAILRCISLILYFIIELPKELFQFFRILMLFFIKIRGNLNHFILYIFLNLILKLFGI